MKKIFLSNDDFTLVSDEDFLYLVGYRWHLNCNGYVIARIDGKDQLMHRIIIGRMDLDLINKETDHINHDKLNNQRNNLRVVTHSQNQANRYKQKNNTSGYKGVTWIKNRNKWQAQIYVNGKNIWLGYFENIENAIARRHKAEIEYFGEYRYETKN